MMDKESKLLCNNCRKYVVAANFSPHSAFCHRNIIYCKICNEPVPKHSLKEHEEKNHGYVTPKHQVKMKGPFVQSFPSVFAVLKPTTSDLRNSTTTFASSNTKSTSTFVFNSVDSVLQMDEPFRSSSSNIYPVLKPQILSPHSNSRTTSAAGTTFASSNTKTTFMSSNPVTTMVPSNPTTTSTFMCNPFPYPNAFPSSSTNAASKLPNFPTCEFPRTISKRINFPTTAAFTSSIPTSESANATKILDIGKLKISGNAAHGHLPTCRRHPLSMAAACADETQSPSLQIGDRVVWINDSGPEFGEVKWLGKLPDFRTECVVGVEFDNPVGTGSGKYKDRQLFHARLDHASLIPIAGLMKAEDFLGDESSRVLTDFYTIFRRLDKLEQTIKSTLPVSSVPASNAKEHWKCMRCTLLNPDDVLNCEACSFSKIPEDEDLDAYSVEVPSKADDHNSSDPLRCIICIEKERDTVFQPCGHLVVCTQCAKNFKSACPVCRKPIQKTMKVYIN